MINILIFYLEAENMSNATSLGLSQRVCNTDREKLRSFLT